MDAFLLSIFTPDFEYFYSYAESDELRPLSIFTPDFEYTFTHSRVKSTQTPE